MTFRRLLTVVGLSTGLILGIQASSNAATLTQPTNGATVPLQPTYMWTMGSNEVLPWVYVNRTPVYNSDAPEGCQPEDIDHPHYSCTNPGAMDDGTWYAYVETQDANTGQFYDSPIVRFTVPAEVGFANTDPWGGNPGTLVSTEPLPGVPDEYNGRIYVSPFSTIQTDGWLNDPGAKITVTYIVKHGHRVVRRTTHIEHAGAEEDWQFQNDVFFLFHVRGVRSGARLRCTVVLAGDGATAQKTVSIRNPPPGGRVQKG